MAPVLLYADPDCEKTFASGSPRCFPLPPQNAFIRTSILDTAKSNIYPITKSSDCTTYSDSTSDSDHNKI